MLIVDGCSCPRRNIHKDFKVSDALVRVLIINFKCIMKWNPLNCDNVLSYTNGFWHKLKTCKIMNNLIF